MAIKYDDLDDVKKGQVTDLLSKREAVDGALADIQTERAGAEVGWAQREQELRAESNRLTEELRKLRKATKE